MSALQLAALLASSFAAGVMNAIAGGGTILTFPTLLLIGEPAIRANATSTLAILPGTLASAAGYRRELATHREWLRTLFVPSLVGGALGSVLLLRTPEATFSRLAPWLVLFATVLFALQALLGRSVEDGPPAPLTHRRWAAAAVLQLAISIYGGYFGAGMGILMLVVLGYMGLHDIHAMNGLKNVFGACINSVAAVYFAMKHAVDWPVALVMMAGAIAGGYAGAGFARRIGRERARVAVVVIGLSVTALLALRRG